MAGTQRSSKSGIVLVAMATLVIATLGGLGWAFYYFSQEQRCERSTASSSGITLAQAAKWCARNARWT